MSLRIFIAFSLLACLLAACSQPAPTIGEAKDFAVVCDKANNGKRVAVEGYLRFPDSFTGDQSVVLRLYETDSFQSKPIGIQTEFGTQTNQVDKVTDQFSDSDLHVHLANGQTAEFGQKVKVSGSVYFPLVGQEFDCALENPLVEAANG
jgi:hypothetical protein